MKNVTNLLSILGAAAILVFAFGCSTTRQTENLLSEAGFRAMPATTSQQQALFKTLPPDKVTIVVRDGKTHYVFPDIAHQVLYVGEDAQFQEYQKLRLQHRMAEEQAQAAEHKTVDEWAGFGGM
jgi:N-methylhydantoinase A/oxoprolinase/acetone carboxylase beta subunit